MYKLYEILEYENDFVIYAFLRYYNISYLEAKLIFKQTLKWLYLCNLKKNNREYDNIELMITNDIIIIDEMWHTFILCTADYTAFCDKFFQSYIHHLPNVTIPETHKSVVSIDRNKIINDFAVKYRKLLEFILNNIDEDTVQLWFVDFAERYSNNELQKIYKKG